MGVQPRPESLVPVSSAVAAELLDVTVLMGGPSNEREVSLESGQAVAEALRKCGHRVTTADISPDDTSALQRKGADVVFIALHGAFGEDGQVQKLCEQEGVAYVGSVPRSSHLAMDKEASKHAFRRAGLATADWVVIETSQDERTRRAMLAEIPPPCVVKPIDGGSSVDITIAEDTATRDKALAKLLADYGRAMVEAFVTGREMTVGILADKALPVVEILTKREFYDYKAKYLDEDTRYIAPAELPAVTFQHLQAAALAAHRSLGCRDFSRVDFILADDRTAYVLEVNTIPGFTSHSLLPKAADAVGISFQNLCDRLVQLAMTRSGR
ncbi:hypothetical protein LCGC14_2404160 [marine sediment metagenome]|uniref:ATP-grasp domain-containing protein n=1 Tax=marine sediment metagenome TaxID=412755 RepID=A0A0F9E6Q6_9ZZZZ